MMEQIEPSPLNQAASPGDSSICKQDNNTPISKSQRNYQALAYFGAWLAGSGMGFWLFFITAILVEVLL